MKIALLYASWPGEPWSTPKGWHEELVLRGHEVNYYNILHANGTYKKNGMHIYSDEGVNILHNDCRKGYKPDVIYLMDYGMYSCQHLNTSNFPLSILIAELADLPQSFNNHRSKYGQFNLYFGPCYQSIEILKSHGLQAYWQTHFADTNYFYSIEEDLHNLGIVTTCGSRGYRHLTGITEKLKEKFGENFINERYFFGKEHARFLAKGKITFQCSQFGEITRRVFEAMAVGNMVITDRLSESTHLQDLFIDGQDIIYYDTIDECIEKIDYFLNHDVEREKIAMNGKNKVINNHSIVNRVDEWENIIEDFKIVKKMC